MLKERHLRIVRDPCGPRILKAFFDLKKGVSRLERSSNKGVSQIQVPLAACHELAVN